MEDEDGEERGKKLGKRVRACTTLYSLVSEFRRRHAATENRRDVMRRSFKFESTE